MAGAAAAAGTRRAPRTGFTLFEVCFALMIFMVMVILCVSVITAAAQASHFGNSYAQAMGLAQHKIDQLQEQGHARLATTTTSGTTINVTLDNHYTYDDGDTRNVLTGDTATLYFTNVDHLKDFFPVSTDTDGTPLPYGKITVEKYGGTGPAPNSMLKATILIKWRDPHRPVSSYQIETFLSRNGGFSGSES